MPYRYFSALTFLVATTIAIAVHLSFDVKPLVSFLCGINGAAIFVMGLDKSLSKSNAVRSPETVLYLLALLGGSPGILLGIHVFKHKTRKAAFQFVLLLVVAVQVYVLQLFKIWYAR